MQIYIVTVTICIVALHALSASVRVDIRSLQMYIVSLSVCVGPQTLHIGSTTNCSASPQLLFIAVTIGFFIQTVCFVTKRLYTVTDTVFPATPTVLSIAVRLVCVVRTSCFVPTTIHKVPPTIRETIISTRIRVLQSYKDKPTGSSSQKPAL